MADNKQNSETENKTTNGGSAASTKRAKEETSVTDTAKDAFDKAKESAGTVATEAIGQVKDKAASVLDGQKTNLASGVASVADSIRQVGENLSNSNEDNQVAALAGKYGDNLAAQIEKFSSYIDDKEIKELVKDVEQFARRNPLLFVGGAFALGVLAARFLKSSGRKQSAKKHS